MLYVLDDLDKALSEMERLIKLQKVSQKSQEEDKEFSLPSCSSQNKAHKKELKKQSYNEQLKHASETKNLRF